MSTVLDRPLTKSLDDFESIIDGLAVAQQAKENVVSRFRDTVREVADAPALIRQRWQKLVRLKPDELHPMRAELETALRQVQQVAAAVESALPRATALAGELLPGADRIPAARAELDTFVNMIFSRWTSEEELIELMVDTFELPEWVLKGPNPPGVGFPQHWIDDVDDDPFQPLPDVP